MTDPRFNPPPPVRKHCMNCLHHRFVYSTGKVHCEHPLRPAPKGQADACEVIRWAVGCPQHEPQKEST